MKDALKWSHFAVKKRTFLFVMCKIYRYFAKILKLTMNQQEIRSKYYLHSDVFHPESANFFSFLQNDILFFGNALILF